MKTKAITLKDIPDDVHYRFKVACLENRIEMKTALINFMRDYGDKGAAK